MIFVVCGGIPYILGDYVSHFLYLKIYTGMYNFMKEIPVYIFCRENSLFTLIYDVLSLITVGVSVTQLVHKPCGSVITIITPLMYHNQGRTVLSNVWPPRSFVTSLFCSM